MLSMQRQACRLAAVLLISACESSPLRPADGPELAVQSNQVLTLDFDADASCTGEEVTGTLRLHQVVSSTTDARGRLHTQFHGNVQGGAVTGSSSGTVYRLVSTGHETDSALLDGPPPLHYTQTLTANLVSAGPLQNAVLHLVRHVTINADGTVTSEVERETLECRG
jgi:hypothetical protein